MTVETPSEVGDDELKIADDEVRSCDLHLHYAQNPRLQYMSFTYSHSIRRKSGYLILTLV